MKVMIMAAGKGTRLRPITDLIPKPMAPIANRPALFHIVGLLHRHGFNNMVMNLHHLPDTITDYFGNGKSMGVNIHYSFEPELLGTAGGVKNNQAFLDGGTFLVMSGDALTDIDLTGLLAAHKRNGSIATLAVKEVADPSLYGVVVTDDDGRVVGFQEKPTREEARSRLCNCGIYVFEPEIFDHILPQGDFDDFGTRVLPDLLKNHIHFHAEPVEGYWSDVGNLDGVVRGNFDVLAGRVKVDIPGKEVRPGVWVEGDVAVDESARLEPPVVVGRGCRVEEGAVVEGPAIIGENSVVESGCHVLRGIVLADSLLPSGSVLVSGTLGRRTTA
jgi:NDP-sugar pyrophosphorylase family protein